VGRWLSQDPLGEKYYGHSPYLFCAGNPVRYVDPRGKIWEDSQRARELEEGVITRIGDLITNIILSQMILDLGGVSGAELKQLNEKMAYSYERIEKLQQSILDISLLEADLNNIYTINFIAGGYHFVHKENNEKILIDASSNAFALHEIAHVRQGLMAGGLRFSGKKLVNAGAYHYTNVMDGIESISNMEVEAYRIQHAYDESFYLPVRRLSEINIDSVGNMRDGANEYVYDLIHKYSESLVSGKNSK